MSLLPQLTRAFGRRIDEPRMKRACAALELQAKNLDNAALYAVQNVSTALDDAGALKPDPYPGQRRSVDAANAQVRALNAKRQAKYDREKAAFEAAQREGREWKPKGRKKADANGPQPPVPLKEFGAADPEARARPFAILNETLLDNILRVHLDQDGFNVYANLPAVVAQKIIRRARRDYTNFFKANEAWKADPSAFTGRPQPPGYLERNERTTVTIPGQAILKTGVPKMPPIGGKTLHTDYAKRGELSAEDKAAFDAYPLAEVLAKIRRENQVPEEARLCEIRLVPEPGGETTLEAVYAWDKPLPEASYAARIYAALEAELDAERQARRKASDVEDEADADAEKSPSLSAAKLNVRLLKLLWNTPAAELPRAASGDPGCNNLLTLVFSTGHRALVIANDRIETKLRQFDAKIDFMRSMLMPKWLKELQSKRDRDGKLTGPEWKALKRGMSAVNKDPHLIDLYRARERWLDDVIHKVTAGIVRELKQRRIDVLALGRNKFWKHESDMGRKQNRRFHNTPHARLYEQLRYKCLAAGILVVMTEESYTSKTSFVLNETLQTWQPDEAAATGTTEADGTTDRDTPSSAAEAEKVVLRGRRGKGKRRHEFKSPGLPEVLRPAWENIHADVNGAFNILRKVFSTFRWHAGLSSKFTLAWLSPKEGLVQMRLKAA